MKCPKCNHSETVVPESRHNYRTDTIRRRRECVQCRHRFTTHEFIEDSMGIMSESKDLTEVRRGIGMAIKQLNAALAAMPCPATKTPKVFGMDKMQDASPDTSIG